MAACRSDEFPRKESHSTVIIFRAKSRARVSHSSAVVRRSPPLHAHHIKISKDQHASVRVRDLAILSHPSRRFTQMVQRSSRAECKYLGDKTTGQKPTTFAAERRHQYEVNVHYRRSSIPMAVNLEDDFVMRLRLAVVREQDGYTRYVTSCNVMHHVLPLAAQYGSMILCHPSLFWIHHHIPGTCRFSETFDFSSPKRKRGILWIRVRRSLSLMTFFFSSFLTRRLVGGEPVRVHTPSSF